MIALLSPTAGGLPFGEVARRELPVLYRVARRLVGDPTEAEDLVGLTLMKASGAWTGFDGRHPRSWLIRILRNCAAANRRTRAARPVAAPEVDVETMTEEPWTALDWGLVGEALLAELDRLPEEMRLAVALSDIEGMAYDEVASRARHPARDGEVPHLPGA